MVDARREFDAFKSFFATFELTNPVDSPADLADGAALYEVLAAVDAEYFGKVSRPAVHHADNWALRFNSLKRLFRLMNQYYTDVLKQPTTSIQVPNLQAIAQDYNLDEALVLCQLTIAIAVQSQQNKSVIERIQNLNDGDQHALMKAIEQARVLLLAEHMRLTPASSDDHYYEIQSERSRILNEKETLVKVYQTLLEEHRTLQTNFDDVTSERDDALARLRQAQREEDGRRHDKADVHLRAEIDHLRAELSKSEESIALTEGELDKQTSLVTELTRKVEELQVKADEAVRLKDQVDEYRHAADKLQKTENVMEKYKKKLEESADLRRTVKALEEQNAGLVDKNASLEEEFRKVAAFKPLMESYKSQISELETKNSQRTKENDALKYELEQSKTRLKIVKEERQKDSEALELYQERVRELELVANSARPPPKPVASPRTDDMTEEELLSDQLAQAGDQGLGGELDDAITGTTMTDLKLQVRKLQRDLETARSAQADGSRVLVLENLLDDANRMKARYEKDYLAEHRSKLVLQSELEEIRSGKALGDGAEANIALRQRLNEVVESMEELKKQYQELEVKFESQSKELVIAKSDLNLVNKDQLEILATLRESVNEDKVELEAAIEKVKGQNRELQEKNKMQLEQINTLLLEKVNLQGEGISQREKMLERERDFGDLRASLNGRDLPPDIKSRMLSQHEEIVRLTEAAKTAQEKLLKARGLIKTQDKMIKEQQSNTSTFSAGNFEEAEESMRSQYKILEDDIARYKRLVREMAVRYKREQELMLAKIIEAGNATVRGHLGAAPQRVEPTAWLHQQRKNVSLNYNFDDRGTDLYGSQQLLRVPAR
ncbi:HOOK-domain-containing protein [Exidia glandulosa HHB12029]|uniref:HOOK-domain-containing protein n=1 Tax=Exidia glandulosa HHB12029 TaxID=1314781 RepID=A0A165IZ03_EXIGL|nr:HOOK-domain-containing protein [Exidia glandulosa HHB12029]